MIGRVVETNGEKFAVGDRVLCVPIEHFGFYERFPVSEARAIPVDPRPPEDQALLAQPLGTVLYGLKKYLVGQRQFTVLSLGIMCFFDFEIKRRRI